MSFGGTGVVVLAFESDSVESSELLDDLCKTKKNASLHL